jgi:lysozyme
MGYIKGIDLSHWQGTNILWDKVKEDDCLFAFIKATEGTTYSRKYIDMGIKQASDAKAAGLKIGYYHFCHPDNNVQDEANFFIDTINDFPEFNLPLVLDLEDQNVKLSKQQMNDWIVAFKQVVESNNHEFILYSGQMYLDKYLPDDHQLGNITLFQAMYPHIFNINNPPKPPIGWNKFTIWQYTPKGNINGVPGPCDVDLMQEDFFNKY